MRGMSIAVLLAGIGGLIFALTLDPSIGTAYGRVNNIGLMNEKQNYVIASGLVMVVGAVLFGFSLIAPKTESIVVSGEGKDSGNIFLWIMKGNEGAVVEYVTEGGDLTLRSTINGMTPLEFARSLGRTKITEIIEREMQAGRAA